MFKRFFEKRAYRSGVIQCCRWLLFGLGDVATTKLFKVYPNFIPAIDNAHREGQSKESATVTMVAAMVSNYVEQRVPWDTKMRVVDELHAWQEGEAQERDTHTWTKMVQVMTRNAAVWKALGRITDFELNYLLDEVVGAFLGKDSNTRQADRIIGHLVRAVLPSD